MNVTHRLRVCNGIGVTLLAFLLMFTPLLSGCGPSHADDTNTDKDTDKARPVIFVPGITGSVLVSSEDSSPLWPPGGPGADINYTSLRDDFRRLSLNPATGPHEEFYASDVIRDYGADPIYSGFFSYLKEKGGYVEYEVLGNPARRTTQGAVTNQKPKPSLFVFAYDWRLPIEENAHLLSEYVEVVNGYYPEKKVDIVTHSMGGLVARRYIIDHPGKVNKLITVAAPFLGSAKPLYQMIYGKLSAPAHYGMDATIAGLTEFLTGGPVQDMVSYYPGLHELMSSRGYFALGGPPYTAVETVSEAAGEARLPETKEISYVELMGAGGIVDQLFPNPNANGKSPAKTNREFHSYSANGNNQDDWSNDTTGVKYYHLIGVQSGHDTPLSIRESQGYAAAQVRDYALNLFGPGDGTVPRLSAERIGNGQNYNAPGAQVFVFDKGDDALLEHTGLMLNPEVMAKVLGLLQELEIPQVVVEKSPMVFPLFGAGSVACVNGIRTSNPNALATWSFRISNWTDTGLISNGRVQFIECEPGGAPSSYNVASYEFTNTDVSLMDTSSITFTAHKTTAYSSSQTDFFKAAPEERTFTITVEDWRETGAMVYIGASSYRAVTGKFSIDPDLSK